jgi:Fe-S cluster assembly protein SufD
MAMTAVLDFPVKPEARPYVEAFAAPTGEPKWLTESRRRGLSRFAELGFPNRRSEAWRYLDLRALEERPLPAAGVGRDGPGAEVRVRLASVICPAAGQRLVLVDGRFAPELSHVESMPGVWFGSIAEALRERPEILRRSLASMPDDATRPFAALNAALFADGFVLDVEPGIGLDQPVEIVHFATGEATASLHTRGLVSLGDESRATIVESYAGGGRYWRNDVVDLHLGAGAALDRVTLVEEGSEAVHLGDTVANLGPRSRLATVVLLLGGRTTRQDIAVRFGGSGARCRLDGAFVVSGRDEANIVTTIDHAAPDGELRESVKGIAAGRGHGAFQGRIIVREGAQKVDAQQTSRNLLLGRQAVIDTKPELEILADDVKCSHGATVGDLDEAALFYLQARGIPQGEARRMLIEAFVRDAVEAVESPQLRESLLQRLGRRLAALEE